MQALPVRNALTILHSISKVAPFLNCATQNQQLSSNIDSVVGSESVGLHDLVALDKLAHLLGGQLFGGVHNAGS